MSSLRPHTCTNIQAIICVGLTSLVWDTFGHKGVFPAFYFDVMRLKAGPKFSTHKHTDVECRARNQWGAKVEEDEYSGEKRSVRYRETETEWYQKETEPVLLMKALQWSYDPRLHRGHPLSCSASHSCRGNTNSAGPHQPTIPRLCTPLSEMVFHTTSLVVLKTQSCYSS